MKRYTFQVTKDVEILAVDELDAHSGLILGDYESETTKRIEFLYASSEDFFVDESADGQAEQRGCEQADDPSEDISMEEVLGGEQNCETEPCAECDAYDMGYADGLRDGYDDGQVQERARVREALLESGARN